MKFSIALLSSVLLATETLAAPQSKSGLARRQQRRAAERTRQGSTMTAKESKNSKTKANSNTSTSSDVEYSQNWSGAAITSPPTGQTFNAVSAKITIPTPSIPSGVAATDGEYSASAWIGIDGNTYSTAILQTGVDFTISTSGAVTYEAWYEWYPDYAYDFTLDISAGDVITMFVNATTTTSGSATIENLTTGKTVTKELTSTSALGGQNAEWIVEDFEQNDALIAFADFGNVTFTECVASTSESSEGVSSATIMDIENSSDEVLTDVTLISDSSFQVSYTASASASTTSTAGSGSGSSGSGSGSGGYGGGNGGGNGGGHGNSQSGSSGFGNFVKRYLLWAAPQTI
ncbi:putative aspergillopepsin-2 precursor [Halenospora varia]|nr:putative aspergillopepsin-2 precursor [Halenospora varia]